MNMAVVARWLCVLGSLTLADSAARACEFHNVEVPHQQWAAQSLLEKLARARVAPPAEGEIKHVDAQAQTLTITSRSGAAVAEETVVFRLTDPGMLQQVRRGDRVRFYARRGDGDDTLTELLKLP
jgi:Cu/Ag efflux protein CusF